MTQESSYWVELQKKGSWLFKVPEITKAGIKCNNFPQEIVDLPEQGILTIVSGYTIRTNNKILLAHHSIKSESYYK